LCIKCQTQKDFYRDGGTFTIHVIVIVAAWIL